MMSAEEREDEAVWRVPIVEEDATISKRAVDTGTVRVSSTYDEIEHVVREQLLHQEVEVARVPIDRVIDAIPDIQEGEDLIIIPVAEERLVVRKELVLVEEIHLKKRGYVEQVEQPVSLRSTRIEVERLDREKG